MSAEPVEYLTQNKIGESNDHNRKIDISAHANPNSKKRRIRVGIDVGGTFTKAVAINMVTGSILGQSTLPTTQ